MKREILSGISMLLSYTAFVLWLFSLTILENQCTFLAISPVPLVLFFLAVYLLDLLMAKRNVNLAIYVGLQLVLAAVSVALFYRFSTIEPFHLGTLIFMGIFLAGGVFACGYAAADPVQPKNLIFYFDSVVVLMILLLLIHHIIPLFMVTEVLVLCFIAMVFSMLSLTPSRTEVPKSAARTQSPPLSGQLMVGAALTVILLLSGLFILFAASGTRSLSQALFDAGMWLYHRLHDLAKFLFAQLERFILWLVQFLPEAPSESTAADAMLSTEGGTSSGSGIQLPSYFKYIGLGLLAILVLKFLLSMIRERAENNHRNAQVLIYSRRSGTLASGMRHLLRAFKAFLTFLRNRIRYKNTAPGLLLLCQFRVPAEKKRKAYESGPAFLLRLSREPLSDAERSALRELSRLLEETFYSPTPAPVPRAIAKVIRSCKF